MFKRIIFIVPTIVLLKACSGKKEKDGPDFSYDKRGYYYSLISFHTDTCSYQPKKIAWVTACFKTQSDSIFWDSYNNLNDRFYIETDSLQNDNFLKNYISKCSVSDSACILMRTQDFYRQQFKAGSIPFFSRNDSVVKVNFKIKEIFSKNDFVKMTDNLQKKEMEQIENFFGSSRDFELARDPLGFYWIKRPESLDAPSIKPGDLVTVSYQAQYLNGRFFEKSEDHFEFIYGTPDQLVEGINYVISRLKLGESAKIILPSRLAFGEKGSSNGIVPPYTPLIYEVKIINLKTNRL